VSQEVRAVKHWERDIWDQARNLKIPMSPARAAAFKKEVREQRRKDRWVYRLIEADAVPDPVKRKLAKSGGDWYGSGIENAWMLPEWPKEKLLELLERRGLSTR
jgi:post-segregation antitoxin (ccd killing protein)